MQFKVIVVTDPQTHKQTGAITIYCATASLARSVTKSISKAQTSAGAANPTKFLRLPQSCTLGGGSPNLFLSAPDASTPLQSCKPLQKDIQLTYVISRWPDDWQSATVFIVQIHLSDTDTQSDSMISICPTVSGCCSIVFSQGQSHHRTSKVTGSH